MIQLIYMIQVYEENDVLKWHILNPSLKDIVEELKRSNQHPRLIFPKMTFADLEDKPLVFLNGNRPFRRYLCLHAQDITSRKYLRLPYRQPTNPPPDQQFFPVQYINSFKFS
jgi:hypothetical protein